MGTFLAGLLLAVLAFCPHPAAQAPLSRVHTTDGRVLVGRVLDVTEAEVGLETAEGVVRLPLATVRSINLANGEEEPTGGGQEAPAGGGQADPARSAEAGGADPEARAAEAPPHAAVVPEARAVVPEPLTEGWAWSRYARFLPSDQRDRLTLGGILFLLFALVIRFSAWIVEVERREFGRCCAVAAVVFLLAAFLAGFAAAGVPQAGVVLAGAAIAWLIATRLAMGARLYEGLVMLVMAAFAVSLGVLVLEMAAWVKDGTHAA